MSRADGRGRGGAPGPEVEPTLRPEDEVAEELRHYLELRARELVAEEGLGPAEARREAERRFGDREAIERTCVRIQRRRRRRKRRGELMTGWAGDLRHACRGLIRTPTVTLAALATLALGIGANTAVFSVVWGVLLRPLPFDDPHELVMLHETREGRLSQVSPANYLDWRRQVGGLTSLAAVTDRSANLLEGDSPSRLRIGVVSGSFFATLGVDAAVGRTFDPRFRIDPALRQVVLGHGLWISRFGGDPGVVGRTIRLDERVYEVVGVAPRGVDFPEGVALWIRAPSEVPGIPGYPGDITQERSAWYFDVVGRLADGTSLEAARAELDAVAAGLREAWPDLNEGAGIAAVPLREEMVGSTRPLLLLLLGAVTLVLLVACANVANLALVRAEGRRREFSVRTALGAGGAQLLRLVLAEGLVLALAGGLLGAVLAAVALPGLRAVLPADLPRRSEILVDGTVLVFTASVAMLTCLLFTVAPALLARRTAPAWALAGRTGDGDGRAGPRFRAGLVVLEVALGVVLAAGTGLIVRSVAAMTAVEPGFRAEGLATVRASFPDALESTEAERSERWRRVLVEVEALPGVASAGVGIASPVSRGPQAGLNVLRGDDGAVDTEGDVVWHPATPGYLEALGVPLLRGRPFDERDRSDGTAVALVSRGLADRFFPDREVLGQRVTIGLDDGHAVPIEIVGVVGDTRNRGPVQEPTPVLYRPLAQAGDFGGRAMTVAARGPGDEAERVAALSDAVRRAVPDAVVYGEAVGPRLGEGFYVRHRFTLRLLGLFAALAVGLAAVGIYGVTAHSVSRRRREIGIRMAVGASRRRVLGSVLRGGLGLTLAGVGVGVALTALAGRFLAAFLFRVEPMDVATLVAVASMLFGVAALALVLPARQAMRVDPAESMRAE